MSNGRISNRILSEYNINLFISINPFSILFDTEEEILLTRFGQPFKSMEDAVLFMSCYNREESIEQIKTHLLEKLEETKDETFPYYYPCEKAYRLFRIFTTKVKGF